MIEEVDKLSVTISGPGFSVQATRTRDEYEEDDVLSDGDLWSQVLSTALGMASHCIPRMSHVLADLIVMSDDISWGRMGIGPVSEEERAFVTAATKLRDAWEEHDKKRDAEESAKNDDDSRD